MRPDFFLFENVRGLVGTAKHRSFYERVKIKLAESGYAMTDRVLNALLYGVPQDRHRLFLIGFLRRSFRNADAMADRFDWLAHASHPDAADAPWPTTAAFRVDGKRSWPRAMPRRYRILSVDHWFRLNDVDEHPNGSDCFKPRSGLARMLEIEEGDTARKSFKRLHRYRYSPTAAYGNNEVHLHPFRPRRLTVAEAMAIQSIPADFILPEMPLTGMYKGIGNAVPHKMAVGLARSLAETLRGADRRPPRGRARNTVNT